MINIITFVSLIFPLEFARFSTTITRSICILFITHRAGMMQPFFSF